MICLNFKSSWYCREGQPSLLLGRRGGRPSIHTTPIRDAFGDRLGDLAAAGETVTLYNTAGEVVHKVDIPELPANISYAMDSAGHFGYAKVPTPGAENSTAISKTLDAKHRSSEITHRK